MHISKDMVLSLKPWVTFFRPDNRMHMIAENPVNHYIETSGLVAPQCNGMRLNCLFSTTFPAFAPDFDHLRVSPCFMVFSAFPINRIPIRNIR